MGIFCEGCPDPCAEQFEDSYNSSDHIVEGGRSLAFNILIDGFTGTRSPVNKGDQIDPETGFVIGPKIECCNSNVTEASMVLTAASITAKRRADRGL